MQRFRGDVKHLRGEMTAFLAILFAVMSSFICSIISVASIHEVKSESRAIADLAIYSVFGEYQKTLLEEYHVFGMDAGYESGKYSQEAILQRLKHYGAQGADVQITDLQFLTDNEGQAFYEQVLFYMETVYGVEFIRDMTGLNSQWEEQLVQGEEQLRETENLIQELEQSTEEAEVLENSLAALQNTNTSQFLEKIRPSGFQFSTKGFNLEQMPSRRTLNHGFGSFQQRDISGITNRLLFHEYLLQTLSYATDSTDAKGMAYEIEYIIAGKGSDRENLEAVVKKIVLLRFVPNYAYIQTDQSKRTQAETIALALSTAMLMPELSEAVAQAILLIWAYEESMEDMKTLLSGGSVSFSKDAGTWSSELELLEESASLVVQDSQTTQGSLGDTSGMDYKDYLRILLFLTKRENASMRSLDAIEYALRYGHGQADFRIDLCVAKLRMRSSVSIGYGMTFDFPTEYMYK